VFFPSEQGRISGDRLSRVWGWPTAPGPDMSRPMPFNDVALQLRENDDVAVLKRALPAGAELVRDPSAWWSRRRAGWSQDRAARASRWCGRQEVRPDHRLRPGRHRPRRSRAHAQPRREAVCPGLRVRSRGEPVAFHPPEQTRCFAGYARAGGRVGTRNYLAVISTVNCSASVAQFVRQRFRPTICGATFRTLTVSSPSPTKAGAACRPASHTSSSCASWPD